MPKKIIKSMNNKSKVEKQYMAPSQQQQMYNSNPLLRVALPGKRGYQVYNMSQILGMTGRDFEGRLVSWGTEQPFFYLSIGQRNEVVKLSSPVFGVISSRMNRIAGIDFDVTPIKQSEDRIADELKMKRDLYKEFKISIQTEHLILKANIVNQIKGIIPEILPDLSNFNNAMLRWKRKIQNAHISKGEEIKEWLLEPNAGVDWKEYIKKIVYDMMVHGCAAVYKQSKDNQLMNFDTLAGGTVYKLKSPTFSGMAGYIQVVSGYEPQIMFNNELMYIEYLPTSTQNYGLLPLEALINKVAEGLLVDKLMAEQADGTRPPEKLVIVTDNQNPFADFDKDTNIPIDKDEQKRLETKLNEPIKNRVLTFSGNSCNVIDLTRENTMDLQTRRQKDIREEVALVFNMSNVEINLSGSEFTSGRETSETQTEISQGKGIIPILRTIEAKHTKEIIPFHFGEGYQMEFTKMKDEMVESKLNQLKQQTGEMTINELRESKNLSVFEDDQYDKPVGTQPGVAGANEISPLFTKEIV